MSTAQIEVVHQDDDLLVVVKPAGLPTTSPDGRGCLTERVQALVPRAARVHPTSRLDSDVTGLVTYALTTRAIDGLLAARKRGAYRRSYLGVVAGTPEPPSGAWDVAIGVDPRDARRRVAVREGQRAERTQTARSGYEVRAVAHRCALLALAPETGRTHQLRVHSADAGHPLLGDQAYGGPRRIVRADGRVVSAPRVMLHCARLVLPHPSDGAALELDAPVPADFANVWTLLGGAPEALS